MRKIKFLFLVLFSFLLVQCSDEDLKTYTIEIKDHEFFPNRICVEEGTRFKLKIKNLDSSVEEFESHSLNREKIIASNSEATIFVGPLKEGEYYFFGEFHEDTAKGYLVVEKSKYVK